MAYFALVHDFFAAKVTLNTHAGARENGFDGPIEQYRRDGEHLSIWHDLIGLHLRKVVTRFFWSEGIGLLANIQYRGEAQSLPCDRVHESGSRLAVVFYSQSAMAHTTIGCCRYPIHKAAIGLYDDQ